MTQHNDETNAKTPESLAVQKLHESEALYRTLFDNAPVGLGITNEMGELVAYNKAMLEPGGYSQDDISAISNVSELYANGADHEEVMRLTAEQGSVHQSPVRFKRKGGGSYEALLSTVPVIIDGKPHIQAMVEDVTQKKHMGEKLRLIGVITEQVADSVIATNLDYKIIYANRAFRDLYGYTNEEVLGQSADRLNAEPLAADIQKDIYETVAFGGGLARGSPEPAQGRQYVHL